MHVIDLNFTSASATLAGTLTTVSASRPGPVVLLISGSGPIDRDSNTKKLAIGVMGQFAEHLGAAGLPSFRYDKRGVGASGGDYHSAGLHDNVADAAAAIEMMRARPDIDPAQIFVVGHSEGALIATELAAGDPEIAGVVLLAGTASTGEEVLRWQATQVAATLPRPVKLLLRLLRQDLSRTQAKRLAKLKASTDDTVRMQLVKINAKWFREFMALDPVPSLQSIGMPVLAITGSKDIQVDPADVQRICQFVPGECTAHVADNLTHLLRLEEGPPSVRTYKKQAKRPIDLALRDLTTRWISEQAHLPTESSQQ